MGAELSFYDCVRGLLRFHTWHLLPVIIDRATKAFPTRQAPKSLTVVPKCNSQKWRRSWEAGRQRLGKQSRARAPPRCALQGPQRPWKTPGHLLWHVVFPGPVGCVLSCGNGVYAALSKPRIHWDDGKAKMKLLLHITAVTHALPHDIPNRIWENREGKHGSHA
jgi:hypothetical protein